MNKIGNKIFALTLASILAGGSVYTSTNEVYAAIDHQYDLVELQRSKLLTNNQFENGTNSWNIVGGEVVSDDQSLGQSGKLGQTSDIHANGHIWQNVTLKPNTTYTLKAKVKMLSENPDDYVTLDVKKGGVNEAKYFKDIKVNASTNQWQDIELSFTTESETTYCVGIGRWIESATESQKKSEAYLDNVELISNEEQNKDNYEIIWADDFNENSLNMNNWEYELGSIRGIEQQHYVDNKENVFVRKNDNGGELVLKATDRPKELQYNNPRDKSRKVIYNSGSVRTHGKEEFLYGRIEMRAKLPKGKSVFPAFWTLGSDFTLDGDVASEQGYGWARCGEIDIMELTGSNEGGIGNKTVYSTIHTSDKPNGDNDHKLSTVDAYSINDDFNDEYHIFGMNWNKGIIEFYVDNNIVEVIDYSKDPIASKCLDRPHYIQMNLAMGGAWPGEIQEGLAGTEYAIDYVYYAQNEQQKNDAQEYYKNAPKLSGYKDLSIYEGDTDVLTNINVNEGYTVDFSITDQPQFKQKEAKANTQNALTGVDLLCTGKKDLKTLASLPAGEYTLYYTGIPENIKLEKSYPNDSNSIMVPLVKEEYKFDRKAVNLTIRERKLTTDLDGKELNGYVGDPLSTISLPEGWSWKNENEIISKDTKEVVAIFAKNGFTKEDKIKINIYESVTAEQLYEKVDEANQYLKLTDIYTKESLNTLKESVDYAESLLKQRVPATFAQMTQAYRNIETAIYNLVKIEKEDDKIIWTDLTPAKPVYIDNNTNTPSQDTNIQNPVQDNNNHTQVNTNYNNQIAQNTPNQVETSDTTSVAFTIIVMIVSGIVVVYYYKGKKQ